MGKTQSIHNAYVDAASEIAKTTKKRVADLIDHGGEKGRVVEGLVYELIECFLPKRFSIGSGRGRYVVNTHGTLTPSIRRRPHDVGEM